MIRYVMHLHVRVPMTREVISRRRAGKYLTAGRESEHERSRARHRQNTGERRIASQVAADSAETQIHELPSGETALPVYCDKSIVTLMRSVIAIL
jgi:hypothetical protein